MLPTDDPLIRLIRRAEEERRRELDHKLPLCTEAMSIAALYLHVAEGVELSVEQARHVQACQQCTRTLDQVRGHFALQAGGSPEFAAISRALTSSGRTRRRRVRLVLGSFGAVAAGLMLAAGLLWLTPPAHADIFADAVNAGSAWFHLIGSVDFVLNTSSPEAQAQKQELARLEQEVREGRNRVQNGSMTDEDVGSFCSKWQAYYCLLRNLGDQESATREARAAIAFAESWPGQPYLEAFLDGLGNIYVAFGDYTEARQMYMESIDVRRSTVQPNWHEDPHYGEPGYEGHLGSTIASIYLRLMTLAIAVQNLPEARDWFAAAERAMGQRIGTICELNLIQAAPDASVWELWLALPEAYRRPKHPFASQESSVWPKPYRPNPSLPTWIRAIAYHESILLREEGKYAAAQLALDRAANMADYPAADEFRLPFLEQLETARLAIIRKNYPAALKAVQAARDYVVDPVAQPTPGGPAVNLLPITPARAAEPDLLEGVALLATDAKDPRGIDLLGRALAVPEALAERLGTGEREAFLKRFAPWYKLAGSVDHDHSATEKQGS